MKCVGVALLIVGSAIMCAKCAPPPTGTRSAIHWNAAHESSKTSLFWPPRRDRGGRFGPSPRQLRITGGERRRGGRRRAHGRRQQARARPLVRREDIDRPRDAEAIAEARWAASLRASSRAPAGWGGSEDRLQRSHGRERDRYGLTRERADRQGRLPRTEGLEGAHRPREGLRRS